MAKTEDTLLYGQVQAAWNAFAGKLALPRVLVMNESRRKKLKRRWREWQKLHRAGAWGFFRVLLQEVSRSSFLRGDEPRRSWPVFDWLIKNDTNAVKVYEGQYRDRVRRAQSVDDLRREIEERF